MSCTSLSNLPYDPTLNSTSPEVCGSPLIIRNLIANYPHPVISALSNFTNITLSSLYFDIVKDTLYADSYSSHQRRVVITVIQQVSARFRN